MATKSKSILIKKPQVGGGKRIIGAVLAQGSTLSGLAASKALEDKVDKKYHGAALALAGIAAAYFVEDENVSAIGTGLGCAGAVLSAKEYLKPEQKVALGLSGTMVDVEADGGAALSGAELDMEGIQDADLMGIEDEDFYTPDMFEDVDSEETETDIMAEAMEEASDEESAEEEENLSGNADLT